MMLRRFIKDRRGTSAVEFALLAPAMIAFYFGIAELGQATMSVTKVANVASSIGDLAAQESSLSSDQVSDIFKIGGLLMTPLSSSNLTMRISSLTANASGTPIVDWSQVSGATALKTGASQSIPTGLVTAGQSVIMAEATYTYNSPVNYVITKPLTFTRTFYLRPRISDHITYCGASC